MHSPLRNIQSACTAAVETPSRCSPTINTGTLAVTQAARLVQCLVQYVPTGLVGAWGLAVTGPFKSLAGTMNNNKKRRPIGDTRSLLLLLLVVLREEEGSRGQAWKNAVIPVLQYKQPSEPQHDRKIPSILSATTATPLRHAEVESDHRLLLLVRVCLCIFVLLTRSLYLCVKVGFCYLAPPPPLGYFSCANPTSRVGLIRLTSTL